MLIVTQTDAHTHRGWLPEILQTGVLTFITARLLAVTHLCKKTLTAKYTFIANNVIAHNFLFTDGKLKHDGSLMPNTT